MKFYNVLSKLSAYGVHSRETLKNYLIELQTLIRLGYANKIYKNKKVYYELNEKALPLLNEYRKILLHFAKLYFQLTPQSRFFENLLSDLRFLNENHPQAKKYFFLSDYQITKPPNRFQLELSKMRYYEAYKKNRSHKNI